MITINDFVVFDKVSDGDFQTKMEGVDFRKTPRETITIQDMLDHSARVRVMANEINALKVR